MAAVTLCLSKSAFLCSGSGDASLVRELPGTGSKASHFSAPDTAEVVCFRAASQPIAAVVTS
ncbi:hypothetical protein BUE60_04220 [Pseudomonas syringae pv. actinidiae]|nr:hypothetical protein BUE61_19280 [Pseudomonas syringae pv. actinidiae]PBK56354.1 hypothetical protein BUE60_04220 [Pseudomonas syringae pv. actinidiae]